ncbi:MAG: glycosyltransferase family 4 protein [Pseudomonadota bacterium]
MPELFVTNYNARFTGVSATAGNVLRQQVKRFDVALVGQALPGCPTPLSRKAAHQHSMRPPIDRPFSIWHVRRNPEMRSALWLRDVRGVPIKIVFTSAAQRLHSLYPRWLISRMDAVIATSRKAASFVPNTSAIVPHGVDTEVFAPAEDRNAAWTALGFGGKRGIASIGRIRPEKGTDIFVDAMLRFLPDHPETVGLVLGRATPPYRPFLNKLKAKVIAAGLGDRLLFPGEISAEKLPSIVRALSLIVHLPRYEGYGMTPLEGLSAGVPFVATDTGYYRSFSADGQVGAIVPTQAEAAAKAVQDLLNRPVDFGAAARAVALERFSIKGEADGISAVYDALWRGDI